MAKAKRCWSGFDIDTGMSGYFFQCDLDDGHEGRHQHLLKFCSHGEERPHDLYDWGVDQLVPCPEWNT